MKKLVFIGCGNMGEAIAAGVVASGVLAAEEIGAVEALDERRQYISDNLRIAVYSSIASAAEDCDSSTCWLLAVKPQQIDDALSQLAGQLDGGGALVISIAAGISTDYIASALGAAVRVVRAMPNTPMLAGCGCTGICPGAGATDDDMDFAESVFAAAGSVTRVSEADMDSVTAVSGSGPAYFFYMIEAIAAAGVAEGLSPDAAIALAGKTCEGAAKLLQQTDIDPAELRRRVTSPGGTTQAAIESMESADVAAAITAAVRAAAARSRELGK